MKPDYPFTTDGCSGSMMCIIRFYWKLRYGTLPPWEKDCVAHDHAYWPGGSAADRVAADAILATAVARCGYPVLARFMFIGVSLGGMPRLPLPWRWGYAFRWTRLVGYTGGSNGFSTND